LGLITKGKACVLANFKALIGLIKVLPCAYGRLFCAKARRYPPFVVGNSTSNISQLIDDENLIRTRMDLLPIVYPIPKSLAIKRYLKQQKMCLSSVPEAGQKVYLHHKIALKLGASVEIIDKKVLTEQNQQDLKKICCFKYRLMAKLLRIG
jgi:hypothetical protein